MHYRYIYWGHLMIGPSKDNMLTKAVTKRSYLIGIVTPKYYDSQEEAEKDDMEYSFHVWDDGIALCGTSKSAREKVLSGECTCREFNEGYDMIGEEEWMRYRIIALKGKKCIPTEKIREHCRAGRPSGKKWESLFPVYGIYPVERKAHSVIGVSDLTTKGEEHADTGKQGP